MIKEIKHAMALKRSSKVSELERRLAAANGPLESVKVLLTSNLKDVNTAMENRQRRLRGLLIVEMANLRDDGLTRFRSKVASLFYPETNQILFNARRDIRLVWLRSTPMREKQKVAEAYFSAGWALLFSQKRPAVTPFLRVGQIVVDPLNFRAQFAIAIMENWRRFAICSNPECSAPYFLFKRKTQKFCNDDKCIAYAHRRDALVWWNKEGSRRRDNLGKSGKKGQGRNSEGKGK
jgi:hypothetical protein